ncbi:MAG TPA: heparinase II/III family protein, partial [Phycisphaerae bacterium]|nr:heparinase II/III family protein [Phycisphaerae bacterium]
MRIPHLLVLAVLVISASLRTARCQERPAQATRPAVLSTLRTAHPRLIVLDDDLARVRRLIETDAGARRIRDELQHAAETMLQEPPVVHKLIGPRLLQQSRLCLSRVYALATMYRLTADARYAQRAEKEMLTAAAFPDWNPSHFLDTAEMSHALGIGYDWLYDNLSPGSRRAIRTALVEKGLNPSLKLYREQKGWVVSRHNWNQVCNGGMTIGALAVADEEPKLAAYIVAKAAESIRLPTARLAPDGGWDEGPGYWNYAMSYTAYYLAALQTSLGTDFGLAKYPGLAETGLFRIHSIGPTGLTFNYADGGASPGDAPEMFFFARLFDRPVYAWHERRIRHGAAALDLLWYDPRGTDADGAALPLDARFRNVDVAFFRSAWNDPDALFAGFKGGDNAANHSHLDLGTFVLDASGERWAIDLGPDDYNLPAYFGNRRWTYYRLRTEGQNTLVINGENQDPKARAPLVAFGSSPRQAFAVADLSEAYARSAKRVRRGVAMLDRKRVLIQDEIEAAAPLNVEWTMHTTAQVRINGDVALLSVRGKMLCV